MLHDLYTPEGETLQSAPWDVYPRPQLKRKSYVNLNGIWEFGIGTNSFPKHYDKTILVPFCPESLLSGIHEHFPEGCALAYRRKFRLPDGFLKSRVLLHIGAADQHLYCFVNDKKIGSHTGGYWAITFDITDALIDGENEIKFRCHDDLRNQIHPYGKQRLQRGGMWYTPVSGIWQTVWLESVPETYIENLDIQANMAQAVIATTPALNGKVLCEGKEYPLVNGKAVITPENPKLWSPEDPYLYNFVIETDTDRVASYFALRTIEAKNIDGIPRLCLNGKPYFFHGLLDQGYWPDGIFTPAKPECYAKDILEMKWLGFNTLRKHIKVEPEEFYYQCDRLGMVVFQDMVNNGDYNFLRDTALPTVGIQTLSDKHMHADENTRKEFLRTMEATVKQLRNHPCILYWTIFNEAWGQFDSEAAYEKMKKLDDSRIIDATSGWFRQKKSDVDSRHIYFTPWRTLKVSDKPLVLSEFGGYAYPVEGHLFNTGNSYGYKACKSEAHFQESVDKLYREKVIPAAKRGLCAAIITQVSDVEDEINGFLTYDRKVNKADEEKMLAIAEELKKAIL
ncbi:MAG: glycoside hydrolase family 2 [Oscillospiraceae bacterium]|nr:glycoside hydrolase family 2 [Oscillospiraceae bacterium]